MNFNNIDLHLKKINPLVPFLTGHTQTILGHIIPSPTPAINYNEHILGLPDGDKLFLEYKDNNSQFTISLYHGLAGDSNADYIRRTATLAQHLGWNIVLVNHRRANSKAHSKLTYHSGRGEDAAEVIKWSRLQFPNSTQVAVGFSMSGSILLNLLTERYGHEQPDYAVTVNAPLDLKKAALFLTKGLSKIYDLRFYKILKKLIEINDGIKLPRLGRTIDIDEIYTSKKNGFKDAFDYYENCSTFKYVDKIKTKTFVLSAYDDPFIDVNDYLNAKWSRSVHLTLAKYGGHMGYIEKKTDPQYGRRWLDHYLGAVFNEIQKKI